VERLRHARVDLALHHLQDGPGHPLLLLHGLGERSPHEPPPWADGWGGPIHALDFTGHGESTVPAGGGYTAEALMGDADAALAHLGEVTVLGRGLGAYVALLLAGARPELVRGSVLADGPGLAGGGSVPLSPYVVQLPPNTERRAPDPFALAELSRDLRPADYAVSFAWQAASLSELPVPISVSSITRPEWLQAVVDSPGAQEAGLREALLLYGS
jgi:pimeloyl-ACP methyl ester carboxylesterase